MRPFHYYDRFSSEWCSYYQGFTVQLQKRLFQTFRHILSRRSKNKLDSVGAVKLIQFTLWYYTRTRSSTSQHCKTEYSVAISFQWSSSEGERRSIKWFQNGSGANSDRHFSSSSWSGYSCCETCHQLWSPTVHRGVCTPYRSNWSLWQSG